MQHILLNGKELASSLNEQLKSKIVSLNEKYDFTPTLATILVGEDPASKTYVAMKQKSCERLGMKSIRITLSEETTTKELLQTITELNENKEVHGILLQHPVPSHIDERLAFDTIALQKDVDGVSTLGFGRMCFSLPTFLPCTPIGIMTLLQKYKIPIKSKQACIVGRSPILGKPMAMLLLNANATVNICHSHTKNLDENLASADIIVAACAKPNFIKGDALKEGVVIVDAGYNKGNVGDVDFESCVKKASYITPVPGGVGPMTITMLLQHTFQAALQEKNIST